MSRRKRNGRGQSRPGRSMQPTAPGQPIAQATPARCDDCGARADTERERAHHHQGTGHRHWTLIRGVAPTYAVR